MARISPLTRHPRSPAGPAWRAARALYAMATLLAACGPVPPGGGQVSTAAPQRPLEPAHTASAPQELPPPAETLKEIIESYGIIAPELVDFSTAAGWPAEDGQSYELLGAVTLEQTKDGAVGLLYVSGTARASYPPDLYLILWTGGPPEAPEMLLVNPAGARITPQEVAFMKPEEMGLKEGQSAFLFTSGSVRCNFCLIWCWCFNCKP